MPTAVLIANPSASQFTGGGFRTIKTTLERSYDLDTQWPVSARESRTATREAARRGVDAVFAMGGDGVAHHVANALVGTSTALGLIPVGTTNVLARILGIPLKAPRAAEAAIAYRALPTRMIRIDATTDLGDMTRHATFSVGFGFDADVVEAAEARPFAKSRFGGLYYATTATTRLISSWRTVHPNMRMTCGDDHFDALVALTQVHNPYTYFGRWPLHLTPNPPEGVATLAANDLGLPRSSEIFARAAIGLNHREATGIKLWTDYDSVSIHAEPATPFQADGELLGLAREATLTPVEGAIRILRPDTNPSVGTAQVTTGA